MTDPFRDITLGEHLSDRSHPLKGAMYRVYLKLSEPPPSEWSDAFEHIWRREVYYSMKRPVGIEGGAIWIECVPEEIKQHHRKELEKAFSQTNTRYREWLRQEEAARATEESEARAHRKRLDDLDTG